MKENKKNIYAERFYEFAKENGYIPKSEYKSLKRDITLECPKGHVWTTKPKSVFAGSKCSFCQNRNKDYAATKFNEYLKENSYKQLSDYKLYVLKERNISFFLFCL